MTVQRLTPFTGLNKDLGSDTLPLGALTDSNNVRFREGYAELFLGQSEAYTTAPIAPYTAFPVRTGSTIYWLVLGANKAYCVTGNPATWTNVTRQTTGTDVNYSADLDTLWNGCVLNGVPIVNNGVDDPQYWATIATGTKLAALPNWPASTKARVLRAFGVTMFALDITQSGTRYPHRVLFSHPADPGSVPDSWDVSDPTKETGQTDLEGNGFVVDAVPMGNSLIIYKQFSTHVATFTGGQYVYQFRQLFSSVGAMAPDCVVEHDGLHYVLTQNDVMRHDGSSTQSILDKATRRWLFKNINQDYVERCFVAKNPYFNEIWICFPSLGETSCNKALVYNYRDGVIGLRDLPSVTSANVGLVDGGGLLTVDEIDIPVDAYVGAVDENEFGPSTQRLLLCSPTRTAVVLVDSGSQSFGAFTQAFIERTGLSLDTPNTVKTVSRFRPRVKAPNGTVLTFRIGGAMDLYGPITWAEPVTFTVGNDVSVDAFATGRYLAYRVESTAAYQWRFEGLDMEYQARGGW